MTFYTHDCASCVALGKGLNCDLWFHPNAHQPMVFARWGATSHELQGLPIEYLKSLPAEAMPALQEALRRAKATGLLDEPKKPPVPLQLTPLEKDALQKCVDAAIASQAEFSIYTARLERCKEDIKDFNNVVDKYDNALRVLMVLMDELHDLRAGEDDEERNDLVYFSTNLRDHARPRTITLDLPDEPPKSTLIVRALTVLQKFGT